MTVIGVEEREAMRDSFARLLLDRCTETDVRRTMATEHAHDTTLWREMAELGVLATLVPEQHGGVGGSALEIELLMEEAGKTMLPGPFFSSAVLATALLAQSSDEAAKARLLPLLAEGRSIATAVLTGEQGLWDDDVDRSITAKGEGEDVTLTGTASYVSDGALANVVLVVAGHGADRLLYEITDRAGLTVRQLKTFDPTQRLACLDFTDVKARQLSGGDAPAIERALDVARVALAGRQAGAARRNFEFTVDYIRMRIQFGRPIGGFQAIKHMAADLLVESESAITGARIAAERSASGAPDAAEIIAMASFAVNEAQVKIAVDSIQMHGGIGFTWAHPAHLYLRRARHDSMFFGSNDQARERYMTLLEKAA